jgi:Collagen triple helix repeat (20 copies)
LHRAENCEDNIYRLHQANSCGPYLFTYPVCSLIILDFICQVQFSHCITGPPGPKGDTGVKGKTGATGPPGLRGATGRRGLTGSPGNSGSAGPIGQRGVIGPPGDKGPPGIMGEHNLLNVDAENPAFT